MSRVGRVAHTPGPWRVGADLERICTNYGDDASDYVSGGWAKTVAKVTYPKWMDICESVANAHLIAASTDLLEALRELLEIGIINPTGSLRLDVAISSAHLAIAKAEGRPNLADANSKSPNTGKRETA